MGDNSIKWRRRESNPGPKHYPLRVLLPRLSHSPPVWTLKNLCPTVCDIYDRIPRSIRDLLADLNRDPWARINLHLFDALVCCVKASLCFDHYLIALAADWNEEGDLKIVGLVDHVWIIP